MRARARVCDVFAIYDNNIWPKLIMIIIRIIILYFIQITYTDDFPSTGTNQANPSNVPCLVFKDVLAGTNERTHACVYFAMIGIHRPSLQSQTEAVCRHRVQLQTVSKLNTPNVHVGAYSNVHTFSANVPLSHPMVILALGEECEGYALGLACLYVCPDE